MTIDADFDRRLRAALVDLRPEAGAPLGLRSRVAEIPTVVRVGPTWRSLVRSLSVPLVAAGVAAAAVAVAAFGLTRAPIIGPVPGTPGGVPVGFDASVEGPGIVTSVVPLLQILPVVAALIVVFVGMRWALRWRWHNLVLRAAPVVLAAGAIATLAAVPGFAPGSAYGPTIGYDVRVNAPFGSDGPDVWYSTAEPGGPTVVFFMVRNPGPLPIRLEGLIDPAAGDAPPADTPRTPRWTAIWLAPPGGACCATPLSDLTPFRPTTVAPGEELQLFLVGRAGKCAYGPGYALDSPVTGATTMSRDLQFAYSAFGLGAQSTVELPVTLVEPYRERCW